MTFNIVTYSKQRQRGGTEQGVIVSPGCGGRPGPRQSIVPHARYRARQKQVFGREQFPIPKTLDFLLLNRCLGFLSIGRLLAFVPELYHLDIFVISLVQMTFLSSVTALVYVLSFQLIHSITSLDSTSLANHDSISSRSNNSCVLNIQMR